MCRLLEIIQWRSLQLQGLSVDQSDGVDSQPSRLVSSAVLQAEKGRASSGREPVMYQTSRESSKTECMYLYVVSIIAVLRLFLLSDNFDFFVIKEFTIL